MDDIKGCVRARACGGDTNSGSSGVGDYAREMLAVMVIMVARIVLGVMNAVGKKRDRS